MAGVTQSQIPGVRGPEQIGEYRVVRQLGMGGQGAVFLAESPTGTRVAIKVLHEGFTDDPDDRRRFLREYLSSWAAAGWSYHDIPLEEMAYELQARFDAGERFDAEAEVRRRLAP